MTACGIPPDHIHLRDNVAVIRDFWVFLDEDSWSVLLSEAYDSRGQLWRVGLHSLVQYYDAVVPWYRFELWFDLTNGSYVLTGLDN